MTTIRSRFYKKGDMVFISHLDLIRVFERAIRRANIPVAYTQGFNPRPIMAFATALGIGVSSEAEYIDIQLREELDPDLFLEKLNKVLPEGLKLIKSIAIGNKEDSLMSIISSSTYLVKLKLKEKLDQAYIQKAMDEFLNQESIIEIKEKKRKPYQKNRKPQFQEIDIRPLIKDITIFSANDEEVILKMHLAAGSQRNIKPEVVVNKINELGKLSIHMDETRVQRLELFVEKDGDLLTPFDIKK